MSGGTRCRGAGAFCGCRTSDRRPRSFRARSGTSSRSPHACTSHSSTRREAWPPPLDAAASSQVDDHGLHLGVLFDALVAALAAEAGLLEAAERDLVRVTGGVI